MTSPHGSGAKKAGVLAVAVKTGGQAAEHIHKIEAEAPDYLLGSWPDLRGIVKATGPE